VIRVGHKPLCSATCFHRRLARCGCSGVWSWPRRVGFVSGHFKIVAQHRHVDAQSRPTGICFRRRMKNLGVRSGDRSATLWETRRRARRRAARRTGWHRRRPFARARAAQRAPRWACRGDLSCGGQKCRGVEVSRCRSPLLLKSLEYDRYQQMPRDRGCQSG